MDAFSRADCFGWLCTGAACFGTLGLSAWIEPRETGFGTHEDLGLPGCPSVSLLNRKCPGCGLTTSFALMARGRVVEACKANALGPPLFVCAAGLALVCVVSGSNGHPFVPTVGYFWTRWAIPTFCLGAVAIWLVLFLFGGGGRKKDDEKEEEKKKPLPSESSV
jgi:hypothetical protein